MSVTEVKGKPGWYDVRVYDRVPTPGERPRPVTRRVRGLRNARDTERELLQARKSGAAISTNPTLTEYAAAYLESRRAEISRQTLAGYRVIVRRYIDRHAIGRTRLRSITVTKVAAFYADLLAGEGRDRRGADGKLVPAAPVAPETVRGVHRMLSMILKRAMVDRLIPANPCSVARPVKDDATSDAVERGLDPRVAPQLLAALAGTEVHVPAMLALGTGLRRSELLALRWTDVNLEAHELHVNGKIEQVDGEARRVAPKTKRSRRSVPFSPALAGVLRAHKTHLAELRLKSTKDAAWVDEGWLFPSLRVSLDAEGNVLPAGRMWTLSAFAQSWRRAMSWANGVLLGEHVIAGGRVEDFEPLTIGIHDMRHTYATTQLREGVRVEVVSRRLGHSSSVVTLKVYSHTTQGERREGVESTDALLGL